MQEIMQQGTRAVSIWSNDGHRFEGRLYVNCHTDHDGMTHLGEGTLLTKRAKAIKTLRTWAQQILMS